MCNVLSRAAAYLKQAILLPSGSGRGCQDPTRTVQFGLLIYVRTRVIADVVARPGKRRKTHKLSMSFCLHACRSSSRCIDI